MSSSAPLKSALKKSSSSSSSSASRLNQQQQQHRQSFASSSSASTLRSNTQANSKSKAKHTITIARKKAPAPRNANANANAKAAAASESDDDDDDDDDESNEDGEEDGNAPGFEDVEMGDAEEIDTDEEIERSKEKGVKAPKRKRTATTADAFGATLTSLLADPMIKKQKKSRHPFPQDEQTEGDATAATTPAPAAAVGKSAQAPIMALSAHKPPTKASVSLEAKARRALKAEKEEKEDQARVIDVLEGWSNGDGVVGGQEFERGLRKTAQRGVIKLFNAILQASKNAEEASSTLPLSAQAKLKPELGKKKEKDNILGRGGKEDVLTKESFLDMVRKGSTR
ncbi:hypothetical protein I317_05743 [Kwoniella heveanensis CBS 569]|nr:hypothetical protein I317_05743 [Kwoniella heveanensis CBS 569]